MQLIWVSGPTARVVTLSITRERVLGAMALAGLGDAVGTANAATASEGQPFGPHFPPKAKAVIFLFMAGGPSQL